MILVINKKLIMPIAVVVMLVLLIFLPEILNINALRGLKFSSNEEVFQKTEDIAPSADVNLENQNIFQPAITADDLNTKKSRTLLSKVRKSVLRLKNDISSDFTATQQSIDDFVSNLETVLSGKFDNGAAIAVAELEKSEMAVTTAMLSELIQRRDLLTWSKIDLSSIYKSDRVYGIKQYAVSYFDPNLQINAVRYKLKSNSYQLALGSIESLSLEFILRGDSIKRVEVYRDGKKYKSPSIDSSNLSERWDTFNLRIDTLAGIYTIALTDVLGKNYYKHYRFNREPAGIRVNFDSEKSAKNAAIHVAKLQDNFFNGTNILDEAYSFQQQFTKQLFQDGPPSGYDEF